MPPCKCKRLNVGTPLAPHPAITCPTMIELCTFYLGVWKSVFIDGNISRVKREVITPSIRTDMFVSQNEVCAYCRKAITQSPVADFDVDHIVPVKFGGVTCRSNLHLLCVLCHRQKSAFERRVGASIYNTTESICVMTEPEFPAVTPAEFSGLKAGIYSLNRLRGTQDPTSRPETCGEENYTFHCIVSRDAQALYRARARCTREASGIRWTP